MIYEVCVAGNYIFLNSCFGEFSKMDVNSESDWKAKMGFPINYDSGQSTDDDL